MTLEQLKNLNEDETAMLWFMVNKVYPPALKDTELDPNLFTSIKSRCVVKRVLMLKDNIKEEHKSIYDSLKNKLEIVE